MVKERVYTYYIEPAKRSFAHTNEVICKMLAETASSSSDFSAGTSMLCGVICADSKVHNLYYIPSGLLFMLWSSKENLKINFRIFCQEGRGQIRDITTWYKNRHLSKKQKKLIERRLGA